MLCDDRIRQLAMLLLGTYGIKAAFEAARAMELAIESGDPEAQRLWRAVRNAVYALQTDDYQPRIWVRPKERSARIAVSVCMPEELQPAKFRDIAEQLRAIARGARFDPRRQAQLLALADGFERFADRIERERQTAN